MRVSREALRKLQNKHALPSVQACVIEYMEDVMFIHSPEDLEGASIVMDPFYHQCATLHGISKSTVRRWLKLYLVLEVNSCMQLKKEKENVSQIQLEILDDIITENPLIKIMNSGCTTTEFQRKLCPPCQPYSTGLLSK